MTNTITTIATWFVSDTSANESAFPQVLGLRSSSSEFQTLYWHCIACFFASSRRFNRSERHLFFTNTDIPDVEGVDLRAWLEQLGVEVVPLPITYRLPRHLAPSFGNQFYILDIINHAARDPFAGNLVVLDCDCLWTAPVDGMSEEISRCDCLTYTLDERDRIPRDVPINGITRKQMRKALEAWCREYGMPDVSSLDEHLPYHGGEIFAASNASVKAIAARIDSLWAWAQVSRAGRFAFREEAHFLSILYASLGYPSDTARPFIKRMWTNLRHRNVSPSDALLPVWHLPSEKKRGFSRMFRRMRTVGLERWMAMSDQEHEKAARELMGIPHRGPSKFAQDLALKLRERAGLYQASFAPRLLRHGSRL